MLSWSSYLYNWNRHIWNDRYYVATGPVETGVRLNHALLKYAKVSCHIHTLHITHIHIIYMSNGKAVFQRKGIIVSTKFLYKTWLKIMAYYRFVLHMLFIDQMGSAMFMAAIRRLFFTRICLQPPEIAFVTDGHSWTRKAVCLYFLSEY